jgi:hypothetical protein
MKEDATITPAVKKKDDTGKILGRLVSYMAGGDARGRFIVALIVRVIGLIGLILLPTFTGRAINVASDPNGSVDELQTWILYAFIAGMRPKACTSCRLRFSTICRPCP